MKEKLIVILGPTAVGKTRFAVKLADKFNGEIISADSRQVYKHMDIGTGKDIDDYKINDREISYHLIDIIEPAEEFDLFYFRKLFEEALEKITSKNRVPFLVGGTGLYIHSILKNYKMTEVNFNKSRRVELELLPIEKLRAMVIKKIPNAHNTTDLIVKDRMIKAIMIAEQKEITSEDDDLDFSTLVIGLKEDREKIKENITKRLKQRLQNGMIEEVESLVKNGITYEKLDFFGLEYKFIGRYLKCELNYNDMYQKLNSAIYKFAKRQMTWFRKMEREGIDIHWLEKGNENKAYPLVEKFLNPVQ
ncbi:MAG: tRNA (adenosine(37)-N6)-dimethylallyltransferase MiaA [Chlorobi bacterium]|nr:tRNA (adenosine(37)-N6)-dimethylallyltransferase MiaA [Chlorobiota bacterium]